MKFAKRLRELRNEKNLTQKVLGEKLGVTDAAVRLWETERRESDFEMLCKIAKFFEVSVGQLLGEEEY